MEKNRTNKAGNNFFNFQYDRNFTKKLPVKNNIKTLTVIVINVTVVSQLHAEFIYAS